MGNTPERPRPIKVRLFGTFEIKREGALLSAADLGGCKPRHVLEILLLNLGSPLSKARIIETVWGPGHGAGTVATLESYICGIRRTIQPGNTKEGPLRTANGGYLLDPSLVDLDLFRFRNMVEAADGVSPDESYELLTKALAISAEPLLSGELAADWAETARADIAAERLAAQVRAAESAALLKRPLDAIHWASLAVAADPLHERAWTVLVSSYESCGLVAEGLAAYARCRSVFDRDLGCEPGAALQASYLRLLRQRTANDADLAEVVAALVYLGDSLNARGQASSGCPAAAARTREDAGRIVASFLRRAQVAV